jgi:hypothetical protein
LRSITTLQRIAGGVAFAAVLVGGLVVAERAPAPAPVTVDGSSIAAFSPLIPRLPTLPTFAPRLAAPNPSTIPALSRLPGLPNLGGLPGSDTVTPSSHFFVPDVIPGNAAICQGLRNERTALLASPDTPAREVALALNAFHLSVFHCDVFSGN